MYDIILKSLSTLLELAERNDALNNAAYLSTRSAVAETRSYVHGLAIEMKADKAQEKIISRHWADAASKTRAVSIEWGREFQRLSDLFAGGLVNSGLALEIITHLERIIELLNTSGIQGSATPDRTRPFDAQGPDQAEAKMFQFD